MNRSPTKVLEGSAAKQGRTPLRDGDNPAGRSASERSISPLNIYPAGIAARAGSGVAEPLVIGPRLLSTADESRRRNHRGARGEGGRTQGQSRGIRPEAEALSRAWAGNRRES